MAKVVMISDLHANYPALEVVLEDTGDYDHLICAGDMVGYYAEPNEVCDKIKALSNITIVRGNHDGYITGVLSPEAKNIEAYRTEWTQSVLTSGNMDWLKALPAEEKLEVDEWIFTIRHANPWDEEQYIYPDSNKLIDQIDLEDKSVLVLGHTHYPMVKNCGAGLLINPGSVGQPRDRNPMASYAVFDTQTGEVDFRRVLYDVAAYQKHLTKQGWPNKVIQILSRTND